MVYAGQNGYLVKNDKGEEIVCEDVAVWNVLATDKVADIEAGDGIEAMVINGMTEEDKKVLVVRKADGSVATADDIAAAKAAATGYYVEAL